MTPVAPIPKVVRSLVVRVVFDGENPCEDQVEDVGDGECGQVGVRGGGHTRTRQHHYSQQVAKQTDHTDHRLYDTMNPQAATISEQYRSAVGGG